jgi:hypothetical protein
MLSVSVSGHHIFNNLQVCFLRSVPLLFQFASSGSTGFVSNSGERSQELVGLVQPQISAGRREEVPRKFQSPYCRWLSVRHLPLNSVGSLAARESVPA